MQTPHTFIIIGRSGSGKGTQLSFLKKYIEEKFPDKKVQSYNCGNAFREFDSKNNFLSNLVKDSRNKGNYQPDFLATTLLFSQQVFDSINDSDHLFFDGYPRSIGQLEQITNLLKYVGRTNPIFLDIAVSEEEVTKRMLLRKRADDTEEGIKKRQEEYSRAIVPMLEVIKKNTYYTYISVDGMGTPEEVHLQVLEGLKSYL